MTEQFLNPVSKEALNAFKAELNEIIKETVKRSLDFKEECEHHGEDAERLLTVGLQFTASMLESIMITGNISLMKDQMSWAVDRLPHDGVQPAHIINRLTRLSSVIAEQLPAEYAGEIVPYVDRMIKMMNDLSK